ncbi:hypothetical protein C1I97_14490 [Streptomyces sp. NTH33]|uniref:ATP-binding protein n=1 Tax=Streptomyces sp. NTH33 TaxID=1735453 RepID=UPI000DAA8BE4|nr:ATP-binding protein [Streptomyces sp. NTH33]PZH09906.1 hypothetical protein C1I97_14490 [Streptomyces sp. NTH33]
MFPTTARTARHAAERRLAAQQGRLEAADDDSAATVSLLITELTANAALHGRMRRRNARLALTLTPTTLRIEVTDARGDRSPVPTVDVDADGESGRGLFPVASLADAWSCELHRPGGKTAWAESARPAGSAER